MKFTFSYEDIKGTIKIDSISCSCEITVGEETTSSAAGGDASPYELMKETIYDAIDQLQTIEFDSIEKHEAWIAAVLVYNAVSIDEQRQIVTEARNQLRLMDRTITDAFWGPPAQTIDTSVVRHIQELVQDTLKRMDTAASNNKRGSIPGVHQMRCGACGGEEFRVYADKDHAIGKMVIECITCSSTTILQPTLPTIEKTWGEGSEGALAIF